MTQQLTVIRVEELDCATEENELRTVLADTPGVLSLEFDLIARHVRIRHELTNVTPLVAAIKAVGMRPKVLLDPPSSVPSRALSKKTIVVTTAAGVLALSSEFVVIAGAKEQSLPVAVCAGLSIALGGRDTLRKGWQALRTRRLTMALLMSIAVVGALLIGQWPEAAVVIWLFGLAELIEALSLERARNAIRSLGTLVPESALVRSATGDWESRPTNQVQLGDTILVKPGDRVPLDGTVTLGASSVNQAPITGESLPVAKDIGSLVFAGTINERGVMEVLVTAEQGEGTIDRVARSIQAAQAERAPAQRFVDRFAAVYTPIVFLAAIAIATLPPLFGIGPWRDWTYKALVLLVLACPCALVISTPITIVSGLGGAARRGILIKGGIHLEQARRLKTVALDKTGTLTLGKPSVTEIIVLGGTDAQTVLRLAASLDSFSTHPVAHAIVAAFTDPMDEVTNFEAIPGRGVSGQIDGTEYFLGNHRLVEETGVCNAHLEAILNRCEQNAHTAVVLTTKQHAMAVFAVADTIRPESVQAIQDLKSLGVTPVMLTGDNQRTATAVARIVGIQDAQGDLLPDDKLRIVARLSESGPVGMVGDGVNDAPALARAGLGIAMGAAGSDTAIETADIALMDDDPRKVAETIRISRHTAHVLWQNITIALSVKLLFFLLTMIGNASLWVAVLADMGASLVVIANGTRLLRRPSNR